MPAEWAPHRATWIAWPHSEEDFAGKLDAVRWAYTEFVKNLSKYEVVEVICADEATKADLLLRLKRTGITENVRAHIKAYDRTWLRDSAPSMVKHNNKNLWIKWIFNGWALFDNHLQDQAVPAYVSEASKIDHLQALRPDGKGNAVLEGGAFDVDGEGSIMVTEQCLLSDVQERNPGLTREGYEELFTKYLGATKTIWLSAGCEGDDTHGHIDDIARFVAPGKVVVASADKSDPAQYQASQENIKRLKNTKDAKGRTLEVTEIPYPAPIYCDGIRLPASYANFYIANNIVLVPTFNDPNDRLVLNTLANLMPQRKVVGIHCVDWILGCGSLHCSTQQEPL